MNGNDKSPFSNAGGHPSDGYIDDPDVVEAPEGASSLNESTISAVETGADICPRPSGIVRARTGRGATHCHDQSRDHPSDGYIDDPDACEVSPQPEPDEPSEHDDEDGPLRRDGLTRSSSRSRRRAKPLA
jgi:hypothetical protein